MEIKDQNLIEKWRAELPAQLILVTSPDQRSEQLAQFCRSLSELVPQIKIDAKDNVGLPAFSLPSGILYRAIPSDKELEPFLCALSGTYPAFPEELSQNLATLTRAVRLRLYITNHCPFCPKVVHQLLPLVAASDLITLEIVDCELFPELAQQDQVNSAPTLIFEQFRWCGQLRIPEVAAIIASRDPSKLSGATLSEMFDQKKADQVAQMMLAANTIFAPVLDLLLHERWDLRLAAMVALEEVASQNRKLLAENSEALWQCFKRAKDDRARGDIVYLLGLTGDTRLIARLQTLLSGDCAPELREAVEETLATLKAE